MKKWQRFIAVGMAATMVLGSGLPVFAASISDEQKQRYEEGVIEFDEIGTYISNYNMTVKKNNRTLDTMGDASAAGADEIREAAEDMASYADDIASAIEANKASNPEKAAEYIAMSGALRAQARQMEKQADTMENGSSIDKKMVEIQMNMAESTIINTVQGLYPSYYQLTEGIQQLEASIDILEQNCQKAIRSKELGLVTEVDVISVELQIKTMKNSLKSLESQKDNLLESIALLIGKNSGDKIVLGALPSPDYEYAASINVNNDLQKAIGNNYNLMYARREVGSINSSVDKKLKLEEIEREEQSVASKLNQQHEAIILAQQTLTQEQALLEQEQKLLDQAQRKLDLGMISRLDYDQQKLSYDSQASTVKTEEMNLFWAIESYKWIVKGL